MGAIEIGTIIAIVGCFVGLAGWLNGRDKRIADDGEWKGSVNAKLDSIHNDISGVGKDISEIKSAQVEANKKLENHETRITVLESKVDGKEKSA